MSVMLVKTITIAKFTAETHSCRIRLSRKAKWQRNQWLLNRTFVSVSSR